MFKHIIAAVAFFSMAVIGLSQTAYADSTESNAQKAILITGASSGIGRNPS